MTKSANMDVLSAVHMLTSSHSARFSGEGIIMFIR